MAGLVALAVYSGVSPAVVGVAERHGWVSLSVAERLAAALGCEVGDLLPGAAPAAPPAAEGASR